MKVLSAIKNVFTTIYRGITIETKKSWKVIKEAELISVIICVFIVISLTMAAFALSIIKSQREFSDTIGWCSLAVMVLALICLLGELMSRYKIIPKTSLKKN